ncbi:hypothetical protein [Candidatus Chloroploca sp. Khr17]|uniref:hypothetical protein n=1 Tax=Candidatus Chloroploca sp. Khr17 TaxID=2496869 RepID=UPI00101D526E|nr:hypothetical protein [Candidatus Chloroploca sp. Khr17]
MARLVWLVISGLVFTGLGLVIAVMAWFTPLPTVAAAQAMTPILGEPTVVTPVLPSATATPGPGAPTRAPGGQPTRAACAGTGSRPCQNHLRRP